MKNSAIKGFTLVELVMVIAITGVIAVSLVIFFTPAVNSYFDTQRRANLVDMADTALRRMRRDVQRAVPNSIRTSSNQCFELVPTSAGGRLRMGPDTVNDSSANCAPGANCSAWLDTSTSIASLDVMSSFSTIPATGDWIVIGNQNGNEVYSGASRVQISGVATPRATDGAHRLAFAPSSFPAGYDVGRVSIVSNNGGSPATSYVCSGAGTSNGTGTGTLFRVARGFDGAYPSPNTCPGTSTGADILATNVARCNFVYSPTVGNTQQSGYVWMELELADSGEKISLSFGAHVDNVP